MSDDEGFGGYHRGQKRFRRGDSNAGGGDDGPEPGVLYLKLLVPHLAVGSIIGKGGEAIIELQKRVGARCRMSKPDDMYPSTMNERICMLTGPFEGVVQLVKYIHHKTVEKPDPNPKPDSNGKMCQHRHKQVKFLVPNSSAGMIIGKGGSHIKEISESCGVKAIVSSKAESMDGGNERIVNVEGENDDGVDKACEMVIQKISEDPNHMSNQDISHWSSGGGGQLSSSQSGARSGNQMNNNMNGNNTMLGGMMPMQGMMQMAHMGHRGPGMMPGMMQGMGMPPNMGPNSDQAAAMMAAGYGNMLAAFGGAGGQYGSGNLEQLAAAVKQERDQPGLQPLIQDKTGVLDPSQSNFGEGVGLNGSSSNSVNIGGMNLPRAATASLEKLRGLLDASRYAPVAQDEIVHALLILAKHNLLPGIGQNNEMITNLLVSLSAVGSLHDIVANSQNAPGIANGSGSLNSSMNAGMNGSGMMGLGEGAAALAAANGMFPQSPMSGMNMGMGMAGLMNVNSSNGVNGMGSMGGGMDGSSEMKREVFVEDSLVGVVLGPGGKGLREIGRASGGARVSVSGREGNSDRRMVTVAGSPSQVDRAVRFVEELVETERRKRARMAHKRKA